MKKLLLRLEGVSRVYKTEYTQVRALDGVNLAVEAGEFIAIMGPSGSGKSTLMNIIGCLDRPTKGQYLMFDSEIGGLPDRELAKIRNQKIGFIFQTFNLLSRMTILKNVELPLIYAGIPRGHKRISKVQSIHDTVGLGDRIYHRPNELSGGQQQRAAIARALVADPSILLADEPTGNLDSKSGQEIMKIFSMLNKAGKTILMVTHEESMAQYAHRIVRLKDGRIT